MQQSIEKYEEISRIANTEIKFPITHPLYNVFLSRKIVAQKFQGQESLDLIEAYNEYIKRYFLIW